jgi:hypothetical protein
VTGKLGEFYTVDVWDDDFFPYWQSAILHFTQQGNAATFQYIYIQSATLPCSAPRVRGETASLSSASLEGLTNGMNLCAIDPSTFNQAVERYPNKLEPYYTTRSAVVAIYGGKARVFYLPKFKMNEQLFKKQEPTIERMYRLPAYLWRKAFPSGDSRRVSWGENSILEDIQPESQQMAALRAGKFDPGYWFSFEGAHPAIPAAVVSTVDPTIGSDSDLGKLHNVLAAYKHPYVGIAGRTGVLVDSQGYTLKEFVAPSYAPLALQARVEGKVTLALKVNRLTGLVENAEPLSGSPLLLGSSINSAKQWQFDPAQVLPEKISVVIDFTIHCQQ